MCLSVWSVRVDTVLQLLLPLVTVLQQLLLVVQQLLTCLGTVLHVGRLDNGIDRARLLTVATVNALGHVDIVLVCSSGAVDSLFRLDGNGLRGTDGLTQLACNASLFSAGVTSQRMLTSEPRRNRTLLERVVDGVRVTEVHLHTDVHTSGDFVQEKELGGLQQCRLAAFLPCLRGGLSESFWPHGLGRTSSGQIFMGSDKCRFA